MNNITLVYTIFGFRILGLVLFSGYFIYSGLNHFLHAKNMIGYATFKKVPYPAVAVYGSGALLLLGGLGLLLQLYAAILGPIALGLLVLFLIPTTFMMHNFWKDTDPATRMTNQINFLKNLALLGALFLMI